MRMKNRIELKRLKYIGFLMVLLLLLCGGATEAWAYKVTYHVLTLPIDNSKYHMETTFNGKRLEAVRVIVDPATKVDLPAEYKSPLAKNFKYYLSGTNVTKNAAISSYNSAKNKSCYYTIADLADSITTASYTIGSNIDVYVTYEYDNTKGILLDGTASYNLPISGGFVALNRGRNNRLAVISETAGLVKAEHLVSEDFVQLPTDDKNNVIPGTKIGTFWTGNLNDKADIAGQYHFLFKFEGEDPYNILIGTAYNKDYTYIESHASEPIVYKWYKGSYLFKPSSDGNCFMASDDHKKYTQTATKVNNKYTKPYPTSILHDDTKTGYFHNKGTTDITYNTFVLLNKTGGNGYIFMVSRPVNDKGDLSDPKATKNNPSYTFLIRDDNYNNLTFASKTLAEASASYSTDQKIYPIRNVNFKVKTPFYALATTDLERAAHTVTAAAKLSQYTIDNDDIDASFIPDELRRKYCTFTTFRNSAGEEITKYADAYNSSTKEYDVYVDYNVAASIPFKAITPKSTYTEAELNAASWYELTDDGSTEENGKKITAYESSGDYKFKNNGASGTFNKNSEYAFIGDPYELRVILRSTTTNTASPVGPHYVGAAGDAPVSGTNFTVGGSATAGYKWEIPDDATTGSFRLRIFSNNNSGTGYWSWDVGNVSVAVAYDGTPVAGPMLTSNPQIITLNVTGLTYAPENYLIVEETTDPSSGQVGTITIGDITTDGKATITVTIAANTSGVNKDFQLTITEKNSSGATVGTATAINITQGTSAYAGGNVQYNTTATRVKLLTLPTRTYTYKIVDKSGLIAVEASTNQTIFSPISLATIPSIIVSSFILDETLTFYDSYTDRNSDSKTTRLDFHNPSEQATIAETPNTNHNIYVTYTTGRLSSKPINLSEDQEFNVMLNGQYLYFNNSDNSIKSTDVLDKTSKNFFWKLRNCDPYHMLIDNLGAREDADYNVAGQEEDVDVYNDDGSLVSPTPKRQKGAWVWLNNVALPTTSAGTGLAITTTRANAQKFVAKRGLQDGIYEVMVAAGEGTDATTTYYNIGRTSTTDIKIYNNSTYAHGNNVLKFQLQQSVDYQYHLIDMANHDLLQLSSQSPDLILPAEYQSPLVATYSYYAKDQMTITTSKTPYEYEPTDPDDKLSALTDLDAVSNAATPVSSDYATWNAADAKYKKSAVDPDDMQRQAKQLPEVADYYFHITGDDTYKKVTVSQAFRGLDVYVTYTVNDRVKFNDKSSPYMLKFLNPNAAGYYLEDGNDELTPYVDSDPKKGRIQAVYPYCNGDGSLNIYGSAMQEEQFGGGAATRPRWIWFFESEKEDPYHVMIHSNNTISFNGVSHPTYLQTFAVDFVQDATPPKHIVTCGTLPTVGSEDITEYMILGTIDEEGKGQFKLKTTYTINDGTSDVRRDVTSLEQYWKTYNMIKKYVLDINVSTDANYKDEFSNEEETWVVPDELRPTLETKLDALHVGTGQWHSYAIYANATRWNGYNDKTTGHTSKVVERLEHWFQTFDMGDGTFDIENASVPPVLVLLDLHGWEVMRKPLGYDNSEALAVLESYNSPLVDKYYFYSNATKASGCHKYSLRMQNGAERDQIKVNGVHYSSTSLGDLPPLDKATGVKSNGAINDQYVTYTVKEEYKDSYTYNFVDHGDGDFTESGTASKFVLVQNGRFYKNRNDAAENRKSYISKPIFEHTFPEGGNVYDMIVDPHANNNIDIVDNGKIADQCLWYVGPNLDIDKEMGIKYAAEAGATGEPWTEYETKKNYFETGKGGFDPYNIQLENIGENKFLTSHMTKTILRDGAMVGDYTSGNTRITLDSKVTSYPESTESEGYDHTNIAMTNQTFMAVSDANGNMQLMPRFDHTKRVNVPTTAPNNDPWPTTLEDPVDYNGEAKVDDNTKMGPQTTFFVRPQRFVYRIIDNDGNEALRYKRAGDYYPTITEHFMSPLATDFKFYFDHAAYTASVSSEAAYTAAATSTIFQKTATDDADMTSQAKLLEVQEDYYFKIGESEPYTYKKVTVTKAHSGSTDASYTTAGCTETDWTNATVHQESVVASIAAMEAAVDNLTEKGNYYYKIGPYVKDAKSTYIYRKVVVKSGKSDFLADVVAKRDVSDKEITGKALAEFDFDSDECEVFVRYSYNASADQDGDKILQGKWFTVKLADKDLLADGTIVIKDDEETDETGTGVSLYAGAESRSGTAKDDTEYATKRASLPQIGNYYFRVGTGAPYKYNKVEVTAVSPLAYTETLNGDYATEWSNSKPLAPNSDDYARKWQWKFLAAPIDPSSELYVSPDPYAIKLFNRKANYTTDLSLDPNPMAVGIKVNGHDRFSLLSHPSGGYALAVNGLGIGEDYEYTYDFLNGAGMTTSAAATTATEVNYQRTIGNYETFTPATYFSELPNGDYYFRIYDSNKNVSYKKFSVTGGSPSSEIGEACSEEEWNNAYHFNIKSGVLSPGTQLVLNNDITHNYTYKVINNGGGDYVVANPGYLAVTATQDNATASSNNFAPYLPEEAQTPLLRNKDDEYEGDYLYYGSATSSDGKYTVVTNTKLFTLHGLYDDIVYVRYKKYDIDNTPFKVPNMKTTVDSHVARAASSIDVSMNIDGGLPYNIIWYNDNMMQSTDGSAITDDESHVLSGDNKYVWYFEGGDPYALKIKHKGGKYLDGSATMVAEGSAPTFMLLKKTGHDYGILQVTGTTGANANKKLTGYGGALTPDANTDPTKFIIFGLSIHKLIYHLIIAKTCPNKAASPLPADQYVDIPYRAAVSGTLTNKRVYGTTQRDLESRKDDDPDNPKGSKYQLGETLNWYDTVRTEVIGHTYSYDAGSVSIGDTLILPNIFYRPNCTFEFYIEGIYQHYSEANDGEGLPYQTLNNKYKGLKLGKLMSDEKLIDQDVVVNVVYDFDTGLETNAGDGFVTGMKPAGTHYLWYTFETAEATPQLAHYTYVQGMRAEKGRALHYTNDYLWSPLGDVYGFRMYNRYIYKNNNGSDQVLTTASIADNQEVVMGATGSNANRDIYELLDSEKDPGGGSFRVHPLLEYPNNTIFLTVDETEGANKGKLILSDGRTKPIKEWTYGLSTELLNPYYQGAGNVGGLNTAGKTAYEAALADEDAFRRIRELQKVCYNKDNIVDYSPGYYRLCNQPGASSLSPQRYASGYLHLIESTDYDANPSADADGDGNNTTDVLPMHFYSKAGVNGTFDGDLNPLKTGFTESHATRGDIPVPATEYDPSTIFQFKGNATSATIQTQGLYVIGDETDESHGYAKMTATEGSATSFHVDDIGGAVVIIYHVDDAFKRRHYINYYQGDANRIYDLHYYEKVDVDGSKWCMEPANTMGLNVVVNNGGDDYYYSTFCAPYDVKLPDDADGKTYYAYVCDKWNDQNLHPKKVPAVTGPPSYAAGKFVPAGTPVILRVKDESGSINLSIEGNTPSEPLSSSSNIFSGQYLEQLLELDAAHDVYTLGLPFISNVSKDEDYDATGDIDAPLPMQATSGLGFYINATANKENGEMKARWDKNNRYVIHNKIYYRAGSSGASAPGVQFVPVIFGDDEGGEEEPGGQDENENNRRVGDGCVYDILGRKVASAEEVKAGTWYRHLSPGVYIVNGQKVFVGVGRM